VPFCPRVRLVQQKLREVSQARAEAYSKHPVVLQRLRDLQDHVRQAQSQHQLAASHATNLLLEVTTAKTTAIGANEQAKHSAKAATGGGAGESRHVYGGRPYSTSSAPPGGGVLSNNRGVSVPPHLQKLRTDFEKRFEGFEQQVCGLLKTFNGRRRWFRFYFCFL